MKNKTKSQPKLSVVKAGAKKLAYIVSNNPRDPVILEDGIKNYGVACYNEGWERRSQESKLFKDIRLKRLNKDFNKSIDEMDEIIANNKTVTDGTNN